jgi:DNA-directed RNA polymerase specialized sigma24 family protein
MTALVRCTDWLTRKLRWRRGVPADVMSRILDQTAADLRQLAAIDESADARPIINKAINELAKYDYPCRPQEEALMERCLEELPEADLTILRHFKQGKKHREIAALMGTDVDSVRRSLVKTYADLRMKMRNYEAGGGNAIEAESEPSAEIAD